MPASTPSPRGRSSAMPPPAAPHAAQDALRSAVKNRKAAAAGIDRAIAAAESAVESTSRERDALLEQLASAQGVTVQAAAKKQDKIDERIDQGGPSTPVGGPATDPTTEPRAHRPGAERSRSRPSPSRSRPSSPSPSRRPSPAGRPAAGLGRQGRPGDRLRAGAARRTVQVGWSRAGIVGLLRPGHEGVGLGRREPAAFGQRVSTHGRRRCRSAASVAGDLVYWGKSPGSIYHVAMYLGGGKMIHAPRPGRDVEIVPITYWIKPSFASRPG